MDKRFRIFAGLCLLLAAVCVFWFAGPDWRNLSGSGEKAEQETGQAASQEAATVPVSGVPLVLPEKEAQTAETSPVNAEPDGASGGESAAESLHPPEAAGIKTAETQAPEAYLSPIDFAALQEKNPDIYAWLFVEGTDISYPVLQSTDDSFYLNHGENREETSEGSIFSESAYNSKSFEDSITVLYGHHMKSGRMFGNLQAMYSDPEQFEKLRDIVIYTPEKELRYRVFAAVPYDNRHVMYRYGKEGDIGLLNFRDSLRGVKSLDAIFDKENMVSAGDRILVLSTCLMGDRTRRFLVAAKQIQPE